MYSLFNPPESFSIDRTALDNIYLSIAEVVPLPQKGTLNIAFLPDNDIRALNKQYRHKDKSTDVLSFHYVDEFQDVEEDEIV
jgi:ssRNA-specific RNase YbeY (16S rRNA maturation enzyme)